MAESEQFSLRQASFWNKEFSTKPKIFEQYFIEMVTLLQTERITQTQQRNCIELTSITNFAGYHFVDVSTHSSASSRFYRPCQIKKNAGRKDFTDRHSGIRP